MMRALNYPAVALALVAAGAACERAEPAGENALPPPNTAQDMVPAAVMFDTATVQIRTADSTLVLAVEVADRSDQRAYGLMDRDDLDAGSGMIFFYDELQPGDSGFWMYRTRIPLDIAFFDGAGRVTAILQMEPCTTPVAARCPTYSPGVPYFGALEVNRGFLAEHGVEVGDQVVLPGRLGG
ncbi:MAG: DUF192 domain-containing protein [Gemmatimonadota bacterium]